MNKENVKGVVLGLSMTLDALKKPAVLSIDESVERVKCYNFILQLKKDYEAILGEKDVKIKAAPAAKKRRAKAKR